VLKNQTRHLLQWVVLDIFDKKLKDKIDKFERDYYKTSKYKEWKLKGMTNEFSIISGKLDAEEWADLRRAVAVTGLILYGKYKAEKRKIKHYTLFSFENIKPNEKRVALFRKLFGFKVKGKRYAGFADKIEAIKVGKGTLLVPIEYANDLKKYFNEKKIKVKLYDIWLD